jgi:hypothetical protein
MIADRPRYSKPGHCERQLALAREHAETLAGRCLSTEYVNNKTNLSWECVEGHRWEATYNNVMSKGIRSWCPHCKGNVGEEIARAALCELLPGTAFARTRQVPWLGGLELDGFEPDRAIAFEYQGIQHYQHTPQFHRAEGAFEAQQARDLRKRELCAAHGVRLLEVPYTWPYLKIRGFLRQVLVEECGLADVAPLEGTEAEFIARVRLYRRGSSVLLERARAVALRKGGALLSEAVPGAGVPLRFRCGAGHEFAATLTAVDSADEARGPRFCPECGGTRKRTDEELRAAIAPSGFLLTAVWSEAAGGRTRRFISVVCPRGHLRERMDLHNFLPLGADGRPREEPCRECHPAGPGRAARRPSRVLDHCARLGVRPLVPEGTRLNNATKCTFRCEREGHEFVTTVASLNQKAPGAACTPCHLADLAAKFGLEQLTEWESGPGAATNPIRWRCLHCRTERSASVTVIGRMRGCICLTPACQVRTARILDAETPPEESEEALSGAEEPDDSDCLGPSEPDCPAAPPAGAGGPLRAAPAPTPARMTPAPPAPTPAPAPAPARMAPAPAPARTAPTSAPIRAAPARAAPLPAPVPARAPARAAPLPAPAPARAPARAAPLPAPAPARAPPAPARAAPLPAPAPAPAAAPVRAAPPRRPLP